MQIKEKINKQGKITNRDGHKGLIHHIEIINVYMTTKQKINLT